MCLFESREADTEQSSAGSPPKGPQQRSVKGDSGSCGYSLGLVQWQALSYVRMGKKMDSRAGDRHLSFSVKCPSTKLQLVF